MFGEFGVKSSCVYW